MRSMTGFGKSHTTFGKFEINLEIKTVNNRYLDILIKYPSMISSFEPELRNTVKRYIKRGKVNIFIEIKENPENINENLINANKLSHYSNMLNEIKAKLNIEEPIQLKHLLSFPELFEADISETDEKHLLTTIQDTLSNALDSLNVMRDKEGKHLVDDIKKRLEEIDKITSVVKEKAPNNVKLEFDKLYKRILELIDSQKIDRDRLEMELALISDKIDISEELIRMGSHINQFRQALKNEQELGKKLTFILQEMHREANTMNSKTTDIEIAHQVIRIKEEIEKIREQAQNIE